MVSRVASRVFRSWCRRVGLWSLTLLSSLALLAPEAWAEPAPLAVYGRLPAFEKAAISGSGRYIAMLATVEGRRLLLISEGGSKPLMSVPFSADDKVRRISWAGDKAVLVHHSRTVDFATDHTEVISVLVIPLDRSPPWTVFGRGHDVSGGVRGSFGVVQRDGKWFGYFGGFTLDRLGGEMEGTLPGGTLAPDLYEVDLQSQRFRRMAQRGLGDLADRDWLIDGTGAIGASLDWIHDTGRWTLYNGRREVLASGKSQGSAELIGFTPDGNGVVYAIADGAGMEAKWFSVPLGGGASAPFLDTVDVDQVWRDKAGRLIGYSLGQAGGGARYFDPSRDKVYRQFQSAFGAKRIVVESWSDDFTHLLIRSEGLDDPGTWYLVDVAQRRAEPFGYAYPLAGDRIGPSRFVRYTAADGLQMEGVLTLPPGRQARNLPAVVMPHGGPTAHDEPGFDWWAQAYASRGYAVFQPNFRGSTGYGLAFKEAGKGEWGRKMQTDISDGVAELVRQGMIDPKRVAIVGASYGGYAALAGVTLQQGLYRCAVAVAGIGDLGRLVSREISGSNDPVLTRWLKAEIGTGRDLKLVSPQRYADKVTVPVMLIHGKDDTVVDYAQSSAMANALRDAGKPVEFVTLQGEDHWLSKSATRQAMLEASVNFVLKHNPPDPEPAGESKR